MMCPYCGEGAVEIKLKLICTSAICGYRILETCCEAEPAVRTHPLDDEGKK